MGVDFHAAGREAHERLTSLAPDLEPVDWMVVSGSGMGRAFVEAGGELGFELEREIPLAELGMPTPAVAGHGQALCFGRVEGRRVCIQSGRVHPYEGHDAATCTAGFGAVLRHGARAAVLTCAVGGLVDDLEAGQIVALRDQMGLFGPTPLRGAHFIDCSRLYAPQLRERVHALAGTPLREVVYAHARGPQYETPAEVAALRGLGGEVVGMSTTYEALLAAAHTVPCAGLGLVTNVAGAVGLSHEDVQERAAAAHSTLARLLRSVLGSEPPSVEP